MPQDEKREGTKNNKTTGVNVGIRDDGKDIIMISEPGVRVVVVPDEPSAMTLV